MKSRVFRRFGLEAGDFRDEELIAHANLRLAPQAMRRAGLVLVTHQARAGGGAARQGSPGAARRPPDRPHRPAEEGLGADRCQW